MESNPFQDLLNHDFLGRILNIWKHSSNLLFVCIIVPSQDTFKVQETGNMIILSEGTEGRWQRREEIF